jgi:hypothetical protein
MPHPSPLALKNFVARLYQSSLYDKTGFEEMALNGRMFLTEAGAFVGWCSYEPDAGFEPDSLLTLGTTATCSPGRAILIGPAGLIGPYARGVALLVAGPEHLLSQNPVGFPKVGDKELVDYNGMVSQARMVAWFDDTGICHLADELDGALPYIEAWRENAAKFRP